MSGRAPDRFETGAPRLLAGLRRRHRFEAAEADIPHQWRELLSQPAIPGRVGGSFYGVMCGTDATGLEYLCGVEVESFAGLPEGAGRMRVPAQRYAVFRHRGEVETLRATWQQAFDWLASGDHDSAHLPDFELYAPHADPLAPGDGIEIWIGVVPQAISSGS